MSNKLITTSQVKAIRKMGNEKGVGRANFQKAQDDGRVSRFLDGVKNGTERSILEPPYGYLLYSLTVPVNYDEKWESAILKAGPRTKHLACMEALKEIESQQPPQHGEEQIEIVLFCSYKGRGDWGLACLWAVQSGLQRTSPREVFAIGEHHPDLSETLYSPETLTIQPSFEFTLQGHWQVCKLVWRDTSSEGLTRYVDTIGLQQFTLSDRTNWIAFRR